MAIRLSDIPNEPQKPIRLSDIQETEDVVRLRDVYPPAGADPSTLPGSSSIGAKIARITEQRLKPSLREQAGSMIGGTAGGLGLPLAVGAALEPSPFGELAIATAGAFLGGTAGEATQAAFDPWKELGLGSALSAGGVEAASELGGRAIMSGLGRMARPFIKAPTKEGVEVGAEFMAKGGQLLPSQADERGLNQLAESIGRSGFTSGKVFDTFKAKQNKQAVLFAKELVDEMMPTGRVSITEVGQEFFDNISRTVGKGSGVAKGRKIAQLSDYVGPMYEKVDELSPSVRAIPTLGGALAGEPQSGIIGVGPKTSELKDFARKWLSKDREAKGALLEGPGRSNLESIMKMDDRLRFNTMRDLRSKWLKEGRRLSKDMDTSDRIVSGLSDLADQAIFKEELNPKLTPDARRILKEANSVYADAKQVIDRNFSRELADRLDKNPELLMKYVVPEPGKRSEGAIKRIQELKTALTKNVATGSPDLEGKLLYDKLGQTWIGAVIDEATESGAINPRKLNILMNRMGEKTIKEFVGDKGFSVLKKSEALGELMKSHSASSALIVRSTQFGGAYSMYRGAKEGDLVTFTVGGALVLGPGALARMVTSPKGFKLLTSGVKARKRANEIGPIAVRMTRLLMDSDAKERQEMSRAKIIEGRKKASRRTSQQRRGLNF